MTHAGLPIGMPGFFGDGIESGTWGILGFKKIRGKIDWPCKRISKQKIIINN
jgi:hypothetical protein